MGFSPLWAIRKAQVASVKKRLLVVLGTGTRPEELVLACLCDIPGGFTIDLGNDF